MKLIAVLGSRNPEGRTAKAVDALFEGAKGKGAETEKIFLTEIELKLCRQCDINGWGECRSEGRCVIEDDFAGVADRIREADMAVFATPVYWGDLSESMRAFLDRLKRICTHEMGSRGIRGKTAIGICVAGGGGGGAPSCAVSLERILQICGFDLFDLIPVRRQNLDMKKEVLRITGEWIASHIH
jgi:multimeric flavodoxin WrbA